MKRETFKKLYPGLRYSILEYGGGITVVEVLRMNKAEYMLEYKLVSSYYLPNSIGRVCYEPIENLIEPSELFVKKDKDKYDELMEMFSHV